MKNYIKGIKTVAVIFLSLALFSCQDEQIEPIDTLSTTDQDMLKPSKDGGGRVNYKVFLEPSELTPNPLLVTSEETSEDGCFGTCNSTQTLLWFSNDCSTSFLIISEDGGTQHRLNLQSIRLNFDGNESRVIMTDGADTYFADLEHEHEPFKLEGGLYFIDAPKVVISRKVGKGKHRDDEPIGFISIGQIGLEKKSKNR